MYMVNPSRMKLKPNNHFAIEFKTNEINLSGTNVIPDQLNQLKNEVLSEVIEQDMSKQIVHMNHMDPHDKIYYLQTKYEYSMNHRVKLIIHTHLQ
jgi:hypothetical protein